jgi:hypothetical protein
MEAALSEITAQRGVTLDALVVGACLRIWSRRICRFSSNRDQEIAPAEVMLQLIG